MLADAQVASFIDRGFVKIENAFPRTMAEQAISILWRDLPCDRNDPRTWTQPVVRLGAYSEQPFRDAANTPILWEAFDQLVGIGRWHPRESMGTFPVRFPIPGDPGDTGWHVDMSFDWEKPDFMDWRVNVTSKGRALLMLFLFSDTGSADAPTRIRSGSHREIARMLEPAGEAGLAMRELVPPFCGNGGLPEELACGEAGTVYLCHPFLVHAAQPNHGREPRFLAQPPLLPREPLKLHRPVGDYCPVEIAIREALAITA